MLEQVGRKKMNRKVKKRIRKTSAALLLISAIVVAAIPVPEMEAAGDGIMTVADIEPGRVSKHSVTTDEGHAPSTLIPQLSSNDAIYSSRDGQYQFAYKAIQGHSNQAVLVDYTVHVQGDTLSIPEVVEAYIQYTTSNGTLNGYAAGNQWGNPLYYREITQRKKSRTLTGPNPYAGSLTVSGNEGISVTSWGNGELVSTWIEGSNNTDKVEDVSVVQSEWTPLQDNLNRGTWTQTIIYNEIVYKACDRDKRDEWYDGTDGKVVFYLYDIDNSETKKPDGSNYDSEHWNYIEVPKESDFTNYDISDQRESLLEDKIDYNEADKFFKKADQTTDGWLQKVEVGCISNQRTTEGKNGRIVIDTSITADNTRPFFTSSGNISKLILPASIFAIADKAFSGCVNLVDVSFDETKGKSLLEVLGESAFENCRNLESFTLPSNIHTIGQYCFKDCVRLAGMRFPTNINRIGDGAFEGCSALASLDFTNNSDVREIGDKAFAGTGLVEVTLPETLEATGSGLFMNCTKLLKVTLPASDTFKNNEMWWSDFAGCTRLGQSENIDLGCIEVPNNKTNFITVGDGYTVEDFKADVGEKFYFIGNDLSTIHDITKKNEIAFMYRGTEPKLYEIVKTDGDAKLTYQAYSNGELGKILFDGSGDFNAVIPATVGPFDITSIGTDFQKNTKVKSVYIPNTITAIADEAFLGCYNLEKVEFEEPNKLSVGGIGVNAFKTQEGNPVSSSAIAPKLTFYGDIDVNSVPFMYAMQKGNNINNDKQPETYIDFCSGSPTNLHVSYNPKTDKRELTKVPGKNGGSEDVSNNNFPSLQDEEYYDAVKAALQDEKEADVSGNIVPVTDAEVKAAVKKYVEGLESGDFSSLSPALQRVIGSAYHIVVPTGIQSIKEGLFSSADKDNTKGKERPYQNAEGKITDANQSIRGITLCDIEALDDYAFYGCSNLETVVMYSSGEEEGEKIGSYAFGQCENLKNVFLPNTTSAMGTRPFAADKKVSAVYFTGEYIPNGDPGASPTGNHFQYDKGILYETKDGTKDAVVQCLEQRGIDFGSGLLGPTELTGVNSFYPEAFMNCSGIGTADLSTSYIDKIPDYCFANANKMQTVYMPLSCWQLGDYAFKDSGLKVIKIPNDDLRYENTTFYSGTAKDNIIDGVEVISPEGSKAEKLAQAYAKYNWLVSDEEMPHFYTITFYDEGGKTEILRRTVEEKKEVEPPTAEDMQPYLEKHGKASYTWYPGGYSPANRSMSVEAIYADAPPVTYTVQFFNDDLEPIVTRTVNEGEAAEEPKTPGSAYGNYMFVEWVGSPSTIQMSNITGDVTYMARYDHTHTSNGLPIYSASGNDPANPGGNTGNNGGNNSGGNNNGGNNSGDNNNNNNSNTSSDGKYKVEVINGSGGGKYNKDDIVRIKANVIEGYEFVNWTTTYKDLKFTSDTANETGFLMPDSNVVVTANYKYTGVSTTAATAATATATPATVAAGFSANVTRVPSTTGGGNVNNGSGNGSSGSSVEVNRNGISDTGKASATVNGSTDNFVIKVSEDGQSTAAVAEALRNKYGDLSNIRYFAMDINLFDETGRTKVTDTSGLSVTITLPIPDELRQYAGNNKVGAVTAGNQLEDLTPRFTTVDGTPCVTFTASHFSPYTIYVDTANLSSGAYDATPKTGDAIHPKWFLVVGLAMLSAVLFLKKDKKVMPDLA